MGCTKKLILQFVCTYYLGLLPKVHSTILSNQIQDSPPVEQKCFFGIPASGLLVVLKGIGNAIVKITAALAHIEM